MAEEDFTQGYALALIAAGATVQCYEEFGSYQGDWFAKITYDGKQMWVVGDYGSCSYCDPFQSAFDYDNGPLCKEHRYTYDQEKIETLQTLCHGCGAAKREYAIKLKEFGQQYIDNNMHTQQELEDSLNLTIEKNKSWSSSTEEKEQLLYVMQHAIGTIELTLAEVKPTLRLN